MVVVVSGSEKTGVYSNPYTKNAPLPDMIPPPQNASVPDPNLYPTPVAPVPDTFTYYH